MLAVLANVRAAVHVDETRVPLVWVEMTRPKVESLGLKKQSERKGRAYLVDASITLRTVKPDVVL